MRGQWLLAECADKNARTVSGCHMVNAMDVPLVVHHHPGGDLPTAMG